MFFEIKHDVLFQVIVVFCRIGTICMFLPAISELSISPLIRLIFALIISICVVSSSDVVMQKLDISNLNILLINELAIGLCIGITIKILQTTLHTLGMIFSYQAGLSTGMIFDPTQATQGSSYGNLISLSFVVLFLSYDMHLIIIKSLIHSYKTFGFNFFLEHYSDFTNLVISSASKSFNAAVQLSMPFILVGTLINIAAGILSRLIPQMQIFFIMLPVQITAHTMILLVTLNGILIWFLEYFQSNISDIFH